MSYLDYDRMAEILARLRVDLLKMDIESYGIDIGTKTENKIIYHNYLASDPLTFGSNGTYGGDFIGGGSPENLDFEIGGSINGIYINDSIKRNQKIGKVPADFLQGVTEASKITGIPVSFYIAFGALESGWRNCAPNYAGYGGYFGQKANRGGTGSVFQQAQGDIVGIYKQAVKDAQQYGFSGIDLAVWCYLCHNAGNAGAKTILKALNGKLRYPNIDPYVNAATIYVNTYFPKLSGKKRQMQIEEKTLSIPKAYYIVSQIK